MDLYSRMFQIDLDCGLSFLYVFHDTHMKRSVLSLLRIDVNRFAVEESGSIYSRSFSADSHLKKICY